MYLTGGQFKGHKIEVPQNTKPTLSKVRESIFNMLIQYELNGNKFLDMFAGSAIMGLEAISRGYEVKELEINPKTIQIIKKNYQKIKKAPDITLCNSLNFKGDFYDIIYIDPPWNENYQPIISKAQELLNKNGIIIIEYDKQNDINIQEILKQINSPLNIVKSKKYGRCLIDILR